MTIHLVPWSKLFEPAILITLLSAMAVLTYCLKKARPIPWFLIFMTAVTIFLASFSMVWLLWGRYIPKERAVLFESSIPKTHCIRVRAADFFSLVKGEMVVTNSTTIEDIMLAIRSARPFYPKHPVVHWQCFLVVSNGSGDTSFKVYDTPDQGTIFYCVEDTLRSDTLGSVLEKAVAHNK